MLEKAVFMFEDTPLINLTFENGRLVGRENVGYIEGQPDINFPLELSLSELETFLFNRRISLGRLNRQEIYFDGKMTTPYEELKKYNGADVDDECWVNWLDTPTTYEVIYGEFYSK